MALFRTKREKSLFIITLLVVTSVFVYTMVIEPLMTNFMMTTNQVAALESELVDLTDNLAQIDKIHQDYRDIADFVEDDYPELDNDLFRTVYSICRRAGISQPQIEPVSRSSIEDIEGYIEANIMVNFTGDFPRILRFLEEVKQGAFVVKSFNLTVNPSTEDIRVYARLMRIVDIQQQ